jgi:hypothetical protein
MLDTCHKYEEQQRAKAKLTLAMYDTSHTVKLRMRTRDSTYISKL